MLPSASIFLFLLGGVAVSAVPGDESPIRATVAGFQQAMGDGDLDGVMAWISPDYRDDQGLDRAGLRNFLRQAWDGDPGAELRIDADQATVRFQDDRASVGPLRLDFAGTEPPVWLDLELTDEGDAWRIVGLTNLDEPAEEPGLAEPVPPTAQEISLELRSFAQRFVRLPGDSPRPQVGGEHVPLRSSFYFQIASTAETDRIVADSVAVTLQPETGAAFDLLRPGQEFAAGYRGQLTPYRHRRFGRSLLVFLDSDQELEPETNYTVRVEARSAAGARLEADEGVWSFTTEPAPATHRLDYTLDLRAEPDVHWQGQFFNGFAKPSFATSTRPGGRVPHYQLMAEARETYPHAWNLFRDAYLAGFEDQYNPFKAYPNLVRERETRRISKIESDEEGVVLTVEDFFGHAQYGIPANRPLRGDYHPGDEILIADGLQSARATVIAVDDSTRTVRVTPFEQPATPWQIDYPRPLPDREDPDSPGLFPPGGTYLRKFAPPGTAHYYWGRVHHEWDLLVKRFGFRVIPRFAGAPGDLAIDGRGGTTAKCLVQLHQVTRHITSHLIERYGDATLDWPWVVLNEPDLMNLYWRNRDWEELQRFYDYTSDAILRAFEDHGYDSHQVQVGGLELGAIAGLNMRLEDFLTHVSPHAHGPGALERNAAYADPRLEGQRSARVEHLCAAHEGRGAPFDFLSIHTYNDAEMAAAKLIRAKEIALEIDPEYFRTLAIVSHETVPTWQGISDPGAAELFLGNGYFPTWTAHIVARQLQRAAQDPRFAYGGEATLMGWPGIRNNFSTLNDVVRSIRLDDRREVLPSPIFHFVNLLSTLREDFRVLPPKQIGGHAVGGFASATEDDLRIVLYSHHVQDPQSRSDAHFEIRLELIGCEADSREIVQYRIDRDHNSYLRLARELGDRPGPDRDHVFTEAEYRQVAERAVLHATCRTACQRDDSGRLAVTAELAGNGVNVLILRPEPTP